MCVCTDFQMGEEGTGLILHSELFLKVSPGDHLITEAHRAGTSCPTHPPQSSSPASLLLLRYDSLSPASRSSSLLPHPLESSSHTSEDGLLLVQGSGTPS